LTSGFPQSPPQKLGEPAEKLEIALPGRRAANVFDEIAGKPIVVHADGLELARTLREQLLLARFASVGFERHQLDAALGGLGDDLLHKLAGDRLEQCHVVDEFGGLETRVFLDHVGIEISHDDAPFSPLGDPARLTRFQL
jgi:hypothetical protein